jgi:hypothetical protein
VYIREWVSVVHWRGRVALLIQHATRMRHVVCGLSGSAKFFNIISQTARFSENSYRAQNVRFDSLQGLCEIFLVVRRIQRDSHKYGDVFM